MSTHRGALGPQAVPSGSSGPALGLGGGRPGKSAARCLERGPGGRTPGRRALGWSGRSSLSAPARGPSRHTARLQPRLRAGGEFGAPRTRAGFPLSPPSTGRWASVLQPPRGTRESPSTRRTCRDSLLRPPSAGTQLERGHWPFGLQGSKQQSSAADRGVAGPLQTPLPRSVMTVTQGKQAGAAPATSYDSWPGPGRLKPTIVRTVCFFEPVGVLGPSLRIRRRAGRVWTRQGRREAAPPARL